MNESTQCRVCGAQNLSSNKFCQNCGTVLLAQPVKKPVYKKWWFWVVIGVVILGVFAALIGIVGHSLIVRNLDDWGTIVEEPYYDDEYYDEEDYDDEYDDEDYESEDFKFSSDIVPPITDYMTDYIYGGSETTIGKMIVPAIRNYTVGPEFTHIDITEYEYYGVESVYDVINAYGGALYKDYDFGVTFQAAEYPDYGEGYYFCELVRASPDSDDEVIYISATYNANLGHIELRAAVLWPISIKHFDDTGIGPIYIEHLIVD